ncbi:hypothetical protein PPL_09544 [Heterostelium album PN500]|uniref:Uncharacterized protein n=1 Tax=Heterostelium pallidum (strain ATCC 26659 / Pp 5 / PN500) TaxID=670386 RepID=D3BND3_HETP5|nr:hypothetical protein PPL_09544 [Heterostelium album PN500]EFA76793.1 hypothetical protein PPL_09544 [Heterostelium album PN500]|eukprot:XP_020428925.1 hypothetical protein PPL_09544 [Heterostelium album PN500]
MKLFISLVILLAAIGAASADCSYGQRCVHVGESCPHPAVDPWTTCDRDSWCFFSNNPATPYESGNCTAYAKRGEYCDNDYWSCAPGLECFSNEGPASCQYLYFATIGEDCASAFECTNGNDCIDGKCQLRASQEGSCSQTWEDCPYGFSCNRTSDLCIPTLTVGASCSGTRAQCGVGLICSPTNTTMTDYTCVAINSKGLGAACSQNTFSFNLDGRIPDIECDVSQSLLCLENNNGELTCQAPPAITTGNCSTDGCKENNEYCGCPVDSYNGVCALYNTLGAACSESINELIKCAVDNECQYKASGSSSYKSCLYQNCGSIMCDNKCGGQSFSDAKSCGDYKYDGCYAQNSSSFVRPTIFLAIIALVALLF